MPDEETKTTPFLGASAKLTITAYENPDLKVVAQYNPRELQLSQSYSWMPHPSPGNTTADAMLIEFGGVQPQTTQVELLFDGFEGGGWFPDATNDDDLSFEDMIDRVKELASVRDPSSDDEEMRRPYNVIVTWGTGGFPVFRCVIESIVTKYTMFSPNGRVLRATCTVSLKEANLDKAKLRRDAAREQAQLGAQPKASRRCG